jgi:hypothetical protein
MNKRSRNKHSRLSGPARNVPEPTSVDAESVPARGGRIGGVLKTPAPATGVDTELAAARLMTGIESISTYGLSRAERRLRVHHSRQVKDLQRQQASGYSPGSNGWQAL